MNRGQIEIVGLMIIVILVTMGMLFYVSYSSREIDRPNDAKKFVDTEIGTSFISALLKTNVCNVNVDDLITDCAKTNRQITCGGLNSCEQLNQTVRDVLNNTLEVWDLPYEFTIRLTQDRTEPPFLSYNRYNCTEETTGMRAPGFFLIPLHPTGDHAIVKLGICAN